MHNLRPALRDLFAPEFIALSVVLLAAFALQSGNVGPPLCPFRHLTNLPCPGCGMTRAFVALAHGRIVEALGYNLLVLVLFPVAAWHWNRLFWYFALGLDAPRLVPPSWLRPLGYVLLTTALIFAFWRMALHWDEFRPLGIIRDWLADAI
ncbi:MAG: DUF2752 domain-containing protein [Candidatus Alcyoniella australis]|nr:DUF2752 domain-containing protein [Candidatus Alcyoniella australis]